MAAEFKVASAYADFRIDVDEGIDKAKARIKARQKDLDASAKIKLDVDVKDAKASIRREFADERFTIKADADTTLARARLEKLTGEGTFKIKPDVDVPASRRAEQALNGTVSRMANRANAQFDLLKFTALSVGLPAAAAGGAALTVGALSAVPVAFAGMAVAMLRDTDAVSNKWGAFSGTVVTDAQTMSMSLQGEVVGAIDDMGAAWTRLKPQVAAAMQGGAPAIREVTGAATDLAENAMPGLIVAAQRSGDAIHGLRVFAGQTGQGLSDMFVNMSAGSTASGRDMVILGGTVQTLLGRIGQLGANLANAGEGPLRSFDVIVDQLSGTLVDATASGSGTVGMLQGFSTAGSGLVTILHGVVAAAAMLPPGITEIGGSIAATSMLASKFGVDATAGFDGFTKKVGEAKGASAKFTASWTGIASGLFNPAALAVVGLGIGLDILGQSQERAAKYAANHRDNVRELTQAIREDNGALGENVAKVNVKALTDKNAANNLKTFGSGLGDAKLAIEGNSAAYDRLNYSSRAQLDTLGKSMNLNDDNRKALRDLGTEALTTGKSYDQFDNSITGMVDALGGPGGNALHEHINAIINANAAVGEQINSQKAAMEAYYQSEGALTGLSEAQIKARDATVAHTQANMEAVGGELGYRGAVLATKQAVADYTKTNQDHKASEDQKAQALLGAEQAMYQQVQAAGQAAAATYKGTNENERAQIAAAAMNRETVNLANTWQGALPASLQSGISKMTVAEAKAAGLTIGIDNTGAAVYRLPNGKYINIDSSADRAAAQVQNLRDMINQLHDRDIKIVTTYFYGTVGKGQSLTGPAVARAQGGLVGRLSAASGRAYAGGVDGVAPLNGGMVGRALGRSIRDVIPAMLAPGEQVTNARDTARNISELQAINAGQRDYGKYPDTGRPPERAAMVPAQRAAPAAAPTTINVHPPANVDVFVLAEMVSRQIMLRGK